MLDSQVTATYMGLVELDLRTYTTSYVPIASPWQFNTQTLQPMESHVWTSNNIITGMAGRLIELATGYSNYSFGSNSGLNQNNFTSEPFWYNGRVRGFLSDSTSSRNVLWVDYPAMFGQNITRTDFKVLQLHTLPTGTNTGFFISNGNGNNQGNDGVAYAGSVVALTEEWYRFDGQSFSKSQPGFSIGIQSSYSIAACMGYNGYEYCIMNLGTFAKGFRLLQTDFNNTAIRLITSFQNPPNSTFNADTQMNVDNLPTEPTYQGWLTLFKNTYVVEGKTCVGLGVLVAPDFSKYWLIRFTPVDATAVNWTINIGDVHGKFDLGNAMFIKNANFHDTLYITAGHVLRQLPIYPPVVLPAPPPDTEIPILPYRESGART